MLVSSDCCLWFHQLTRSFCSARGPTRYALSISGCLSCASGLHQQRASTCAASNITMCMSQATFVCHSMPILAKLPRSGEVQRFMAAAQHPKQYAMCNSFSLKQCGSCHDLHPQMCMRCTSATGSHKRALYCIEVHRLVKVSCSGALPSQVRRLPRSILVGKGLAHVPAGLEEHHLEGVHADAIVCAMPRRVHLRIRSSADAHARQCNCKQALGQSSNTGLSAWRTARARAQRIHCVHEQQSVGLDNQMQPSPLRAAA